MDYIICGCDLHDANILLKVAYDRNEPSTEGFSNTEVGRMRMVNSLKRLSQKHGNARIVFAYEASCLGFGLHDELTGAGITCYVLAPTKLEKSPYHRKRKTDERDAQKIFEVLRGHLLAGNELPSVWIPDAQTRDDRELVRMRLRVGEDVSRLKGQIQTLLKRTGQVRPEPIKSWAMPGRRWLAGLASSKTGKLGPGARAALSSLLRQLDHKEEEQRHLEKELAKLAVTPRYEALVRELTVYVGVGLLTAMVFLTEIGDVNRFQNRRELASFLGLVPSSHESGEASDRKGHITHQGPGRVRKVLCQAVWAGLRWDGPETKWFVSYVTRHPKRRKIAAVGAMRRLGIRLWHTAQNYLGVPVPDASVPDSGGIRADGQGCSLAPLHPA